VIFAIKLHNRVMKYDVGVTRNVVWSKEWAMSTRTKRQPSNEAPLLMNYVHRHNGVDFYAKWAHA